MCQGSWVPLFKAIFLLQMPERELSVRKKMYFCFWKPLLKCSHNIYSSVWKKDAFCRKEKENERGYYSGKFMLLQWGLYKHFHCKYLFTEVCNLYLEKLLTETWLDVCLYNQQYTKRNSLVSALQLNTDKKVKGFIEVLNLKIIYFWK